MSDWTPLDDISKVGIQFLNGEYREIEVVAFINSGLGAPLWIVYHDDEEREVIVFVSAIQQVTVLARKSHLSPT